MLRHRGGVRCESLALEEALPAARDVLHLAHELLPFAALLARAARALAREEPGATHPALAHLVLAVVVLGAALARLGARGGALLEAAAPIRLVVVALAQVRVVVGLHGRGATRLAGWTGPGERAGAGPVRGRHRRSEQRVDEIKLWPVRCAKALENFLTAASDRSDAAMDVSAPGPGSALTRRSPFTFSLCTRRWSTRLPPTPK